MYSCVIVFHFDCGLHLADPSFEPSIALASLVQHIPVQMITVLIKSLTTDQNVKDASMTKALCRLPHTLTTLTNSNTLI